MSSSLSRFIAVVLLNLGFFLAMKAKGDDGTSASAPAVTESSSDQEAPIVALVQKAGALRRTLDGKGVGGNLNFVNDLSRNFAGGANSSGYINRYSLDVSLTLDTRKSLGWNGGTGFFRMKNHIGESGGDYVGDAQGFSNIDDVDRTRLYELWFEQKLAEDKLRFKLGKIDANTEFAVVHVAGDFLNSSMGYSPTILALPTYPEPKPGFVVSVVPKAPYQATVGLFRVSDGTGILLLEGGRDWRLHQGEMGGRFSLGMWRLTGSIGCFDGDELASTHGVYMVGEQAVWRRRRADPEADKQLSLFVQYGHANGDISRFTDHVGGGAVMAGPFASRSHDAIGGAVTMVRFTDVPQAGFEYRSEITTEAYYKVMLGRFVSLVPDVQFIHHPGGLLAQRDAIVLTPRINISF